MTKLDAYSMDEKVYHPFKAVQKTVVGSESDFVYMNCESEEDAQKLTKKMNDYDD